MKPFLSRESPGFSLAELVIALGILSFAVVAIYGLLPIGLQLSKQSKGDLRATEILSLAAEDFRTWQKLSVPASQTPFYGFPTGFNSATGRFFQVSAQKVVYQDGSTDRPEGERFVIAVLCEPIAKANNSPEGAAARVRLCVVRGQGSSVNISGTTLNYTLEEGVSHSSLILTPPTVP